MTRHIYPLNFLRSFEASARHLSFVKAAEELCVTPAAVSHQVKRLEEYLGIKLFRRLPHDLLLMDKGKVLMLGLREVFLRLDNTMEEVIDSASPGKLTVSVAPMFAVKLLVPWLYKFNVLHPDISIRISSNFGEVDFRHDDFDAAILFGQGKYPGLKVFKLFEEFVTPMCAPRFLQGDPTPQLPIDLSKHVLLHDDYFSGLDIAAPNWDTWFKSSEIEHIDASQGLHFSQPDHALQAAIDGAGFVLGWRGLAANDIAAGRLEQPFNLILPLGLAFYLVYPEAYADRSEIVAFRDWVMQEHEVV
ncbi:MAG: transcriptional regulator GcvA [Betaproteobacteria bacterium]|nr:MAG: transcriptional regulator GcvA [Betaproteobacteria bacterium]